MNDLEKTQLIKSLEHWAHMFNHGYLEDFMAEDIAYALLDKAHDLRLDLAYFDQQK